VLAKLRAHYPEHQQQKEEKRGRKKEREEEDSNETTHTSPATAIPQPTTHHNTETHGTTHKS